MDLIPAPLRALIPPVVEPSPEDAEYYGTSGLPVNRWDETQGPWKNYGDLVCVGGYGQGFDYKKKSPADRLAYYSKMTALVVPPEPWNNFEGDPPGGGLGPDIATPSGIALNYFDCSDYEQPKRKRVWYPTGGEPRVEQRNGDNSAWEDEGFDYEKDLPKIFQMALTAVDVAGSAALAFLTVDPAIIAVWHGALQQMAAAARPGGQIDPFKFIAQATALTKAVPDFAGVMTNLALKNDVIASLYSEATDIRAWALGLGNPVDFVQGLQQTVAQYRNMVPKFAQADFDKLTKELKVPPALVNLTKEAWLKGAPPGSTPEQAKLVQQSPAIADAMTKAAQAFNSHDAGTFLSLRKLVDSLDAGSDVQTVLNWRTSFDMTFSSLLASSGPKQAAKGIKVEPGADDLTKKPLEEQIATWKTLYEQWSSRGRPEAAMALKKIAELTAQLAQGGTDSDDVFASGSLFQDNGTSPPPTPPSPDDPFARGELFK